jgi:hypothetical protein
MTSSSEFGEECGGRGFTVCFGRVCVVSVLFGRSESRGRRGARTKGPMGDRNRNDAASTVGCAAWELCDDRTHGCRRRSWGELT